MGHFIEGLPAWHSSMIVPSNIASKMGAILEAELSTSEPVYIYQVPFIVLCLVTYLT